jgi:hypothetical protein
MVCDGCDRAGRSVVEEVVTDTRERDSKLPGDNR